MSFNKIRFLLSSNSPDLMPISVGRHGHALLDLPLTKGEIRPRSLEDEIVEVMKNVGCCVLCGSLQIISTHFTHREKS